MMRLASSFMIGALLLLTILPSSYAQEDSNTTAETLTNDYRLISTLRTYADTQILRNVHVLYVAHDLTTGREQSQLLFAGPDGTIQIDLSQGTYDIEYFVDEPSTPGKDYYIKQTLSLEQHTRQALYLYAVGSIRGAIYDSENRTLAGSLVDVKCGSSYGVVGKTETDEAGRYFLEWVPTGLCQVTAVQDGQTATEDALIERGGLTTIHMTLSGQVRETPEHNRTPLAGEGAVAGYPLTIILLSTIGVSILLGTAVIVLRARRRHPEGLPNKDNPTQFTTRQEAILATLSPHERDIITLLHNTKGRVTQSTLRYELGIPKTSLARILIGLEVKNIITIKKVGKLKNVYFSDFFRGQDKMDR